jgi:GH25 family lysozyme M1 (1,4-beta-N-acetylmuramidase)
MSLGVDYASIDGNSAPNFARAYSWGARFAIIRGAYTLRGVPKVDPTLARDRAAAGAAGLQIGPYVILGWHADPAAQVANLVAAYGQPQRGDLPPALDIEGVPGVTAAQALAKIETALSALRSHYRTVMIYTSAVWWSEKLDNATSTACGACPLWLKVGYPWKARNPPHPEDIPAAAPVPMPWRTSGSPGVFIVQFQGDAINVPGFTSTVDINKFRNYVASSSDARTPWVRGKLNEQGFPTGSTNATLATAIRGFQARHGLSVDGVIGPITWAALCAS